jgi:urease accessory protein
MSQSWRTWQLLDSAFPTGGFAHSGGVEAAWQAGWLKQGEGLETFLGDFLEQLASGSLPFVNAAASGEDVGLLDAHLDSFLSSHIANRASRVQGMAFVATVEQVLGRREIAELRNSLLRGETPGHHAVMFGAVMRVLGTGPRDALKMFAFMSLRGAVSAAVRLGIVGPLEGQRVQLAMGEALDAAVARGLEIAYQDASQTAPLLELWQMGQDRLYSRLFQS